MVGLRVMPLLPELTADQRAEIRQSCGFACVRCGVTIYRYLGLPDGPGATLLCPTCHGLVEEGRLTANQVHSFHANPVVRQRHFARDRLPFSNELPQLIVGGSRMLRDTPIPITLDGEPILIFADVFDPAQSQLDGMVRLFEVPDFVAEEWPHGACANSRRPQR